MSKQLRNKLLALAGQTATVRDHSEAEWTSPTFAGVMQTITFFFTDIGESDAFIDALLEEVDVNLVGELLADIQVIETDAIVPLNHATVTVEALTLTDK